MGHDDYVPHMWLEVKSEPLTISVSVSSIPKNIFTADNEAQL